MRLKVPLIEDGMREAAIKDLKTLCERTGINRTTLWRTMNHKQAPGPDVIAALSRVLKIPVGVLTEIVEKEDAA